jgi:hypothetical protein
VPYQIKDWNEHFENNKSRERDHCSFVVIPNKQDGMGFMRIVSQPDGAAIIGIWTMILQACSRQHMPRAGWLTDDGHSAGRAWTADDLALRWRRPEAEVQRALDVLSSSQVGWLILPSEEVIHELTEVPAECPPSAPEEKRIEEKGKEESEATPPPLRAVPQGAAARGSAVKSPEVEASPVVLSYPTIPGKRSKEREWVLTEAHFNELAETFPIVNVSYAAKEALAWLRANKNKMKTASGMPDFLFSWMERRQNNPARYQASVKQGEQSNGQPVTKPHFGAKPPVVRDFSKYPARTR